MQAVKVIALLLSCRCRRWDVHLQAQALLAMTARAELLSISMYGSALHWLATRQRQGLAAGLCCDKVMLIFGI